ncbi:MAG: hypothetical protein H6512_10575 [Acidimicrobiia bacterium]|nr:hypothetical protein [Acidimicrobiia bacterium]
MDKLGWRAGRINPAGAEPNRGDAYRFRSGRSVVLLGDTFVGDTKVGVFLDRCSLVPPLGGGFVASPRQLIDR